MRVNTRGSNIRVEIREDCTLQMRRKPTCITSGVMDLAGETGGGLRRKEAVPGLTPEDDDV